MLEFRLEERNNVILLEIDFEHFCRDLILDLCSDINYLVKKNHRSHIQDNKDLRDSINDIYVYEEQSIIH